MFGAGAEIDYNMPSGGKFALEIFRQDSSVSKNNFKKMRENINSRSRYASTWLPDDYVTKNISSYGKSVFEIVIKDTIDHNRSRIIANLNNFDDIAQRICSQMTQQCNVDVVKSIKQLIDIDIRDISMKQDVAFIDVFKEGNRLFASNFFSALLEIYSRKSVVSEETRNELRKILVAILQLQVGALGENLSRRISDNLFSKKDDRIDIFDDLGELIRLNYQSTGVSGLEYLLEYKRASVNTPEEIILHFAQAVLEDIFSDVLDYKTLIDSNWHYLYCPSAEWAKFCKISIFLLMVKEYIESQCKFADTLHCEGYYHDLKKMIDDNAVTISSIATTNYTGLISNVLGNDIIFLNGSTNIWYDPYINKIGDDKELQKNGAHFIVPLLFTQSGTKPMTSIEMSKRYVHMYESFSKSDYICSVGYGFNPDDEHINGVIRTLVDEGKKLLVVCLNEEQQHSVLKTQIADKLKVMQDDNIEIIPVDSNRSTEGKTWIEYIFDKYTE